MTRAVMWCLLTVVACSAAVLSFDSLRTLATLCGYPGSLSALFPVTVDAGAAAACLTWLGGKSAATSVGRTLTWTLLVASVLMNGIVHYVDAYQLRPAWWLIVGVSAIPPATLGACVHLAVLLGRQTGAGATDSPTPEAVGRVPSRRPTGALPASVRDNAPVTAGPSSAQGDSSPAPAPSRPKPKILPETPDKSSAERARALLADNPTMGRRKLMAETGLKEYDARRLLEQARAAAPRNGAKVLEDVR